MSQPFDVKCIDLPLPGTIADDTPIALFKTVTNNGAITILGAQLMCATAMIVGTVNLIYGTLSASNGSIAVQATIGSSFGTGGGTFPALCLVGLSLDSPVVPENKWVALKAGTLPAAGQSYFHVQYVDGVAY